MLYVSVLAIRLAVALLIALVDMVSGLQIEVSKTAEILFTCAVREDSFAVLVLLAIVETIAVEVFATDLPAIILIAATANHEILGNMFDTCLQN